MGYQNMIPLDEKANKNISDRYQKKTYTKGETCIYGNTLYKAKANIDTAEEWNAAHWEKTNLETIRAEMAAELSSLNASLSPFELVTPLNTSGVAIESSYGYRRGNHVHIDVRFKLNSEKKSTDPLICILEKYRTHSGGINVGTCLIRGNLYPLIKGRVTDDGYFCFYQDVTNTLETGLVVYMFIDYDMSM
uniref:Uncharacterized protein n=1 Tax=Siphoviridae sp. ctmIh35 TaxID=2827932 RepID=A0A8S5T8D2_9CAUD|nr:MAG TPA: hypothetical protein [Siphoviridae sp. ctmIh35]